MKQYVKNRNGVDLAVVVENKGGVSGLAFIVHGLGGFKEQIHIRTFAQAFLDHHYVVVTYDAANTIGESAGQMEDATLTSYFEDLEDVTEWAKSQSWYKQPFLVCGHSLGGASSIMYAAKYPERVKAIAPISAFVAGPLSKRLEDAETMAQWESDGYLLEESKSRPGVMKKIGWGFIQDALTHDMRRIAPKITCPALFITGSADVSCSPEAEQTIIDAMTIPAKLEVIEGMGHNPRTKEHNQQLKSLVSNWLRAR